MSEGTTTAAKAERIAAKIDPATGVVTISRAGVAYDFSLDDLSDRVHAWLAGRGLITRISRADDMQKAFDELKAGKIPADRASGGRTKDPSLHEKAIAMAMRDELAVKREVKKADKPAMATLLEEATAMVAKMDKAKKAAARQSASVLAYVASLKAKDNDQKSLLDIAA